MYINKSERGEEEERWKERNCCINVKGTTFTWSCSFHLVCQLSWRANVQSCNDRMVDFFLFVLSSFLSIFRLTNDCLAFTIVFSTTRSSSASANCFRRKYCDSWKWSDLIFLSSFMTDAAHQALLRLRVDISFNYRWHSSMKKRIYITQSIAYNRQKKKENQLCLLFSNGIFVKCLSCWLDQANTVNVSCIFSTPSLAEVLIPRNFQGWWNAIRVLWLTSVECAFCLPSMQDLPIVLNCSINSNKKTARIIGFLRFSSSSSSLLRRSSECVREKKRRNQMVIKK